MSILKSNHRQREENESNSAEGATTLGLVAGVFTGVVSMGPGTVITANCPSLTMPSRKLEGREDKTARVGESLRRLETTSSVQIENGRRGSKISSSVVGWSGVVNQNNGANRETKKVIAVDHISILMTKSPTNSKIQFKLLLCKNKIKKKQKITEFI